jgi:hypothetical protein
VPESVPGRPREGLLVNDIERLEEIQKVLTARSVPDMPPEPPRSGR